LLLFLPLPISASLLDLDFTKLLGGGGASARVALYTLLQLGHSMSLFTSAFMTDNREAQPGHGTISTVPSSTGGGGSGGGCGGGGGTGSGTMVSCCAGASGIKNSVAHFGHRDFLPPFSLGTVKVALQLGHAKRIIEGNLRGAVTIGGQFRKMRCSIPIEQQCVSTRSLSKQHSYH